MIPLYYPTTFPAPILIPDSVLLQEMVRRHSSKKFRHTKSQETTNSDEELHEALSRWSSRLASKEQHADYAES